MERVQDLCHRAVVGELSTHMHIHVHRPHVHASHATSSHSVLSASPHCTQTFQQEIRTANPVLEASTGLYPKNSTSTFGKRASFRFID